MGFLTLRIIAACAIAAVSLQCKGTAKPHEASDPIVAAPPEEISVGAADTASYVPKLAGKRVALYTNHTGIAEPGKHTLDLLFEKGVDVECVFSPEHGFRGTADAGEAVAGGIDDATGTKIVSLYGSGHKKRMESALDSVDAVVVDIQDVGTRFYTYYCTMLELMNGAAARDIDFIVLDRPNPLGMYVDGPILDMKYESGVGRLPIPIVHGLTLGEMAAMANGEGWLKGGKQAKLEVVKTKGYAHSSRYELPVAPSPNLPNMTAVYLYPSLCYFEGTPVSVGRGTDKPFQIYGHPDMKGREFDFTPASKPGAKNPPLKGVLCHGEDLSAADPDSLIAKGIDLSYLIDAYRDISAGKKNDKFFTSFFELLIGDGSIRQMIEDGKSADEIKASWQDDVDKFKAQRQKYLLYPD